MFETSFLFGKTLGWFLSLVALLFLLLHLARILSANINLLWGVKQETCRWKLSPKQIPKTLAPTYPFSYPPQLTFRDPKLWKVIPETDRSLKAIFGWKLSLKRLVPASCLEGSKTMESCSWNKSVRDKTLPTNPHYVAQTKNSALLSFYICFNNPLWKLASIQTTQNRWLIVCVVQKNFQDSSPFGGVSTTGKPQNSGRWHFGVERATWSRPPNVAFLAWQPKGLHDLN